MTETPNVNSGAQEPKDRRALVKTGTLSAGVLLVAALFLIFNYFGFKYYKRFDWTGSKLYSLSPKSKGVLGKLGKDVDAIVFLSPQDELFAPLKETLSRYAAVSPHVHLRVIDAQKNPLEADQLVKKYDVKSPSLVLATTEDRRVIDRAELADFDFSGVQFGQRPQMTGWKGEQVITSALLQLSEGKKPKILFTTGHGELSLASPSEQRSLAAAQDLLGKDNFEMSEWASLGQAAVPPGTDAVIIAGPRTSFVQPELDALAAYLKQDGRLLVLLDPVLGQTPGTGMQSTGLEAWLAGYGVKVDNDIVVDPTSPLPFFGPETIYATQYGKHPITRALEEGALPVILSLTRSVRKGDLPAGSPAWNVTPLVETSAGGWGETDLIHLEKVAKDGADLAGPVSLAVAVSTAPPDKPKDPEAPPEPTPAAPAKGPRLVVFGDSDFVGAQLLHEAGNAVLLSNVVNWLVEREALMAIPPKKTEQVHLSLSASELRGVYVISLLLLPGAAVIMGVWVYFKRRR